MSTIANDSFSKVASLDSLTSAHRKAMIGKRSDQNATASNYRFMTDLLKIQRELRAETYAPLPYRKRIITEPKTRYIEAPAFKDRIVHHSIHSTLSPFYERQFIHDSYACRPNKGIHRAMARVQHFLRANPNTYVCKLDISKYYGSVNHNKLRELLSKRINDQRLLNLLSVIIDSSDSDTRYDHLFPPDSYFHTKGRRGIPIGNLTSQLFANIYLHEVDMYAKQTLKIHHYIRYMDDILLFHPDKTVLHEWKTKLTEFLYEELYLTINPRKVRIYPARIGVDFVGYVIYPHASRVRASSVRRFRRQFNKKLHRLVENKTSVKSVDATFAAWSAHVMHSNGRALIEQERIKKDNYTFVWWALKEYRKNLRQQQNQQQLPLPDIFDTVN